MEEEDGGAADHPTSSSSSLVPSLTVKVAHGLRQHEVTLSSDATFGDLKTILEPLTGVYPHEQRLLFKGLIQENSDYLDAAGVKNKSKLILIEDPASKERKMDESKKRDRMSMACQAVAHVRIEVDKLASEVTSLEAMVESGNKVPENEFALLSELLMRQLLKLDGIDAEGEARMQRKSEVQRVQGYADVVDKLKIRNSRD